LVQPGWTDIDHPFHFPEATMNELSPENAKAMHDRVREEMLDAFDEEMELELDEDRIDQMADELAGQKLTSSVDRRTYFKELFRLQGELVKLQSWVQHEKLKVVVIFEGRDSAGKGGVIKRITQRLNPRICRVAALPAPNERERTQWYFQRYVSHLPAGGEMVLFDRSWYNRAGVERVMGFCTESDVEEFFRTVPDAGALGHHPDQVLVLDHRRGAAPALLDAYRRSAQAVEAVADGRAIARALGGLYQGQGSDARTHAYSGSAVACGAGRR
jgi:hypothetical protein